MGGERPVLWGNLAGIAGNLIWATTIPVTEILLATWPPLVLAAGRLLTAALGVLLLFPLLRRPLRLGGIPWPVVLRLSCLYMVPSVVLAILGGVVASGGFAEGAPGFRGGEIVLLASITLWALFSRATVRELSGQDSLAQSLVTLAAGGSALTLISAGLTGTGWLAPVAPGWREILLLLWMGCIGIGLSTPLWFISVRHLGVTVASMHQNLLPFYVVILAVLLGQGQIDGRTLLGATLVSLGALIAQLPWARMWRGRPTPI